MMGGCNRLPFGFSTEHFWADGFMRLVLVGPPGSGKGTQAKLLVENQGLRYIGTGEILRDAIKNKTPTGLQAQPYMDVGNLVPDELVNQVVAEVFERPDHPNCFVLDGYPRTVAQAIWFDQFMHDHGLDLHAVVQFVISDEEVVRRNSGRRVCPKCKRVYQLQTRPPKVDGICDDDRQVLEQRPDDREETIRARLKVFHSSADQLVAHYKKSGLLREIPTNAPEETIYQSIIQTLKEK
jgi:adenylate kinase